MRRLLPLLTLLALGAATPAQAAEEPFESIDVPPTLQGSGGKTTENTLDGSKPYRFTTSGVITATSGSTVFRWDSHYCFEGCGSEPTTNAGLYYAPGAAGGRTLRDPSSPYPPYNESHTYDVTLPAGTESGSNRFTFTTQPHNFESSYSFSGAITVNIFGEASQCAPTAVTITALEDSVMTREEGKDWKAAKVGDKLCEGHEIAADPDGTATLQFEDGSTVAIQPLTQIRIAAFFREGGVVKTEILLRVGELAAQVKKAPAVKSDFAIRSPTAVTSSRGTKFKVLYDPVGKVSVVSVTEGEVGVDATSSKDVVLKPGQEVAVGTKTTSPVSKIGKAGVPKGAISRAKAQAKVLKALAKLTGCEITIASIGSKGIKRGWKVTAELTAGADAAKAAFKVIKKRKPAAANSDAKSLVKNCA